MRRTQVARPVTVPQDRDLTTLITLGVPVGIVVALFLEIRGPHFNVWALTAYTAFLGTYLCWIFGYEYALFEDLHRLKSRPADTLLVAGAFGGILQVSRTAGAVGKEPIVAWRFLVGSRDLGSIYDALWIRPLFRNAFCWRSLHNTGFGATTTHR
jgi:hypothetical protein